MDVMEIDPTAPYPSPRTSWTAVVILCFLYILSMLDRNVITLMATDIKRDLVVSDFQLSLLYGAAFSIFYALSAVPIGWAIDSKPRRKVIFACVSIWSLATISCGLAVNYATMFLARAFVGSGEAVLTPGANSVLADLYPPEKLSVPLSIYFAGAKLGQSLSLLIASALIAVIAPSAVYHLAGTNWSGWQIIFVTVGLPGLVLAFAIFGIPEPQRRHAAVAGSSENGYRHYWRYVASHGRFFGASHFGSVFYLAITTAIISWVPAFFQRVHGLTPQASGVLLGIALLLGPLIGSPVHGWIVDRQFARGQTDAHLRHMARMGWVSLPVGITAFMVSSPVLAATLVGLFSLLIAGYSALPAATVLLGTPGPLRGKASSILFMVNGVAGITVGPTAVAFLTDYVFRDPNRIGDAMAWVIAAFIPIASLAFGYALSPTRAVLAEQRIASAQ